ncbi:MAG: hypothetical protein JWP11_2838 [Frankiales bacterium]|nr:hypothetical protein [Frankiales bacterium]
MTDRTFEDHNYGTIGGLFDTAPWAAKAGRAQDFLAHLRAESEHADANLGYVIGYGDEDSRRLMYEAFDLAHPMVGGRP